MLEMVPLPISLNIYTTHRCLPMQNKPRRSQQTLTNSSNRFNGSPTAWILEAVLGVFYAPVVLVKTQEFVAPVARPFADCPDCPPGGTQSC